MEVIVIDTSTDKAVFLLYIAGVVLLHKYKSSFRVATRSCVLLYHMLATLWMCLQ